MNKIPLIDADSIVYNAGFAADSQMKKQIFGDPGYKAVSKEDIRAALAEQDYLSWALNNCKAVMEDITYAVFGGVNDPRTYLSGVDNFREQLAITRPYKGNRDPLAKPRYFREIREYLVDNWNAQIVNGMEADDAVGIEQYKHKDQSTCIVSIDKDLNCIPGWHYNWAKKTTWYTTLQEADLFFLGQMVTGDSGDNVEGVRGIGPKGLLKMLDACGRDPVKLANAVALAYKTQYGKEWVARFNEAASLLWILRVEGKPCPYMLPEETE